MDMSNIEEDIIVLKNIEKLKRIEFKHCVTDREIKAINNILAELGQKDKRIQEMEEVDIANRKVIVEQCDYIQNNSIPKQVIIDKIEELKNNLKYIDCNRDCSKCFNKEGKALYRGSDFDFCFAYYQIKGLQELLEGERK